MSFKEWFNYMLKKMVWYIETPKMERKRLKEMEKQGWLYRWFGLVPFSIKYSVEKARKRFR